MSMRADFSRCASVFGLSIAALLLCGTPSLAATAYHLTVRIPMNGPSKDVGAVRPEVPGIAHALTPVGHPTNTWTKLANLPGATVHDVAFASPTVGYAAAELGQIWKTTDGGNTWTEVLNRGFP